jgi:signal transduction histidine kinase
MDPTLEEVNDIKTAVSEAVTNAIVHAYPDNLGKITLRLRHLEGDVLEIQIKDSGIGIPDEDLSHIFDRFYRVDKARSRATGGTGLGLSIVRQMVQLHGGAITVDSTPGQGSSFVVTLPLRREDA